MLKIVDNYTLTSYLGKGEYGKVYKAQNIDTKIDVAVKMIPLSKFSEVNKLVQLTRNELQILKLLEDNINVIKFVQMIKSNKNIYLVYEYCEGGTLEQYIRAKGHIPQKQALRIFKQIINAFKSLNEMHILHRDVKPNNIFFKSGHVKIADFGFCKKLKNFDDLSQTSLGSPLYMAPQVLNGDVYDSKADVWSVGIVLYEMLFGKCPYGDYNIKQLINVYSSEKLRIPMNVDDIFITPTTENMLRKMLEKDQLRRISWEDFFYEYDIDEYGNVKKKEKDFQYDLMKLMKKSSSTVSQNKAKSQTVIKFDWTKITEKNSSIHSEELNYSEKQENIDQILTLKKKVKYFQVNYEKRLELSSIMEQMINASVSHYYSSNICYFLLVNLQNNIVNSLIELQAFLLENKQILSKNPNQITFLNKMVVVFRNQAQTIGSRLNSIKISLISCEDFNRNSLKFPQKGIVNTEVQKFIKGFQSKNPGITNISFSAASLENRNQLIYLTKILWGISNFKQQQKSKQIGLLSIKNDTKVREISKIMNKIIVYINC